MTNGGMTLDRAIQLFASRGYRLTSRSDTTAQMVKPKEFSFAAALLSFLFLGIGLLIYLFIYAAQSDSLVLLTVDEQGTVTAQVPGRAPTPLRSAQAVGGGNGPALCPQCGYGNTLKRQTCKLCRSALAD